MSGEWGILRWEDWYRTTIRFYVMYELDFDSVCIILWDQLSTRVALPTDLCTPW